MITAAEIVSSLRTLASPRDAEGQRRFGIAPRGELLGIRAPAMREIARAHRRNHALALELWATGVHEARIIAALADDPKAVNWAQRQIGKRNPRLRRAAIAEAKRIQKLDSPSARWIAADALRELRSAS